MTMNLEEFIDDILSEEDTSNIKVDNPGVLDLPEGGFMKSGVEHYKALMATKGREEVMHALCNLERWNKEKNPEVAAHARALINKLEEK